MTSRRDFLKRLFLAGAAVAVVPSILLEGPKPTNPFLAFWERLKCSLAPKVGPDYIAFVPPQVAADLMADCEYIAPSQYSWAKQLFKGEIGTFYGVRLVQNDSPFIDEPNPFAFVADYDHAVETFKQLAARV